MDWTLPPFSPLECRKKGLLRYLEQLSAIYPSERIILRERIEKCTTIKERNEIKASMDELNVYDIEVHL